MAKIRVNISTAVNNADIREVVENGRTYIVVPSKTLPDNVIMNGGLYPHDEIEKSFHTLEGTPAPLGHPQHGGEYISANDARAYLYNIGGFNRNVSRKNGVVLVEKWIDKEFAKLNAPELIDAINAGDPIHTSTGLLCQREPAEKGSNYDWIARNMLFDHDAILLGEVGAATPEQGVGMMVNGQSVMVINSELSASESSKREHLSSLLPDDAYLIDYTDSEVIFQRGIDGKHAAMAYTENSGNITLTGEAYGVKRLTVWERLSNFFKNQPREVNPVDEKDVQELKDGISKLTALVESQAAELEGVKNQINQQAETELNAKRERVKAVYGEAVANSLSADGLDALLAKSDAAPAGDAAPVGSDLNTNTDTDPLAGYEKP